MHADESFTTRVRAERWQEMAVGALGGMRYTERRQAEQVGMEKTFWEAVKAKVKKEKKKTEITDWIL